MTDWESLKVVELKEELKSRGVPLTGLKLKQQLIDKLVEVETAAEATAEVEVQPDTEDHHVEADGTVQPSDPGQLEETNKSSNEQSKPQSRRRASIDSNRGVNDAQTGDRDTKFEETALPTSKDIVATSDATEVDPIVVGDGENVADIIRDDLFIPENREPDATDPASGFSDLEPTSAPVTSSKKNHERGESQPREALEVQADVTATASIRVPTPEPLDDQRKRKRRSASVTPDKDEVMNKKARIAADTSPGLESQKAALEEMRAATYEAELSRESQSTLDVEPLVSLTASKDPNATRVAKQVVSLPDAPELQQSTSAHRESQSALKDDADVDLEGDVVPSKHTATRSLYIRNFKRPLHIPSLRSHISQLARPSSTVAADEDPIELFYLDSIRTHAFITLRSVAAATKIRSAMHDTRFPDEPMREPLWIDFIPEYRVQEWIDEETRQSSRAFGGARSGRKFEVMYEESPHGIEARLCDTSLDVAQAPFRAQEPPRAPRAVASSIAPGVHPDRAAFVPQHTRPQPLQPSKTDTGKGFKALDELFSCTNTKPKLYYKLPTQAIVDARIDMIRDLRVDHGDMGQSGDEGMKRYTFEDIRGREEWVDKGPEFGYGRKGQDRLTGNRGRGAYGHRGARRGADSWRGRQ